MGLKKQQEYARQLATLRQITVQKCLYLLGKKAQIQNDEQKSSTSTSILHQDATSLLPIEWLSTSAQHRATNLPLVESRWIDGIFPNLLGLFFFPFIHTPTRLCCEKHPTTELSLRNLKLNTIATNHLLFQAAIGQQHHHFQWFRGFWAELSYFTPPFLWFSSNIPAASTDFCSFHDSNNR